MNRLPRWGQWTRGAFAATAAAMLCACNVQNAYFVEGAALPDQAGPSPAELLLAGHRISRGEGLALVIRRFDAGRFRAVDDETFEKITILIRAYRVGEEIGIESPRTVAHYSQGAAAFVSRGAGYYALQADGSLTVLEQTDTRLTAKLDLTFQPLPARDDFPERVAVRIAEIVTFKKLAFEQLSPWLGRHGDKVGDEAYPPRWFSATLPLRE